MGTTHTLGWQVWVLAGKGLGWCVDTRGLTHVEH